MASFFVLRKGFDFKEMMNVKRESELVALQINPYILFVFENKHIYKKKLKYNYFA